MSPSRRALRAERIAGSLAERLGWQTAFVEFAISYNRMMRVLAAPLGMGPTNSGVRVEDGQVSVWMGRYFSATFPVEAISSVEADPHLSWWWGQGVHSGRGKSVVNGSNQGLVRLCFDNPVDARAPFKHNLRELIVSLEDPQGFLAAISHS